MPYQPTWNNPYLPQNPYQQVIPSQTFQQYQPPVNGITKVNGRDSALQYQLPPNSMSPALFDNNGKVFYIVSTDGTGAKTVEAFDYTQHVEKPVVIDDAEFVSRREYDEFVKKVSAALGALNGVHAAVPTGTEPDGAKGKDGPATTDDARRRIGIDRQLGSI